MQILTPRQLTRRVIAANSLDALAEMEPGSVDACVSDPPYELGFMGKKWDASGIAYNVELWRQVLRVLKPGGHLLAFGGTRTYHRMACAIEDAGFQVRDCLVWLYGSGFPKSLDVSKAIDKAAGAEPVDLGPSPNWRESKRDNGQSMGRVPNEARLTAPTTDDARAWQGWGTALKPAHEPIVMARKPLVGTVAANVLEHGTGAINVDGCRIATSDDLNGGAYSGAERQRPERTASDSVAGAKQLSRLRRGIGEHRPPAGRWPANVVLDEEAARMLDAQSDTGGASRYFYCAKASRADRERGVEQRQRQRVAYGAQGQGPDPKQTPRRPVERANVHPTVKPRDLMRWLVRLVTPPGGLVLDPFTGSGTTGVACALEGFRFVGVELSPEYAELARARIAAAEQETPRDIGEGVPKPKASDPRQASLFDDDKGAA